MCVVQVEEWAWQNSDGQGSQGQQETPPRLAVEEGPVKEGEEPGQSPEVGTEQNTQGGLILEASGLPPRQ